MTWAIDELKDILPDPRKTVQRLNEYIIGQMDAKYILSLMLLNQSLLKLYYTNQIYFKSRLQKTNVLLIGPTGTGKTGLIKALAEISDMPISINDVTSCTAAGYIGGKVEDVLVNHVLELEDYAKYKYPRLKLESNIAATQLEFLRTLAETGIIYLDEIDKICKRSQSDGIDINGDMLQNELLKFLDSGEVNLRNSRNGWKCKLDVLNTQSVLFICGGAFEGLDKIITRRLSKENAIGFNADLSHKSLEKEKILRFVTTDDLIKYGFKPEFLGRVPLRAVLNPISPKMMEKIILESKDSVFMQYEDILQLFGIQTEISKSGLREIALLASEMGMGARALKPIFSKLFEEVLFNIFDVKPGITFVITKRDVQKIYGKI